MEVMITSHHTGMRNNWNLSGYDVSNTYQHMLGFINIVRFIMLVQIDAVVRALAVLGNVTEEQVAENLQQCEDPWNTVIVFLDCHELKVELDRQARLEHPARVVMYGDTATTIRAMLKAN